MIPFRRSQPSPWAQLTCAMMGLEGWASNIKEGVSDPVEAAEKILEQHRYIMENFKPLFEHVEWPGDN